MLLTATIELKLPLRAFAAQREAVQRSWVHHLLHEQQITMPEALALLPAADQNWLVDTLLQDAQESLFLASQIADPAWRQRFWEEYNHALGHLFHWHEQWSPQHNEWLVILRTVVRRYAPQALTADQLAVLQTLTQRLHQKQLYQADIFAATQALSAVGLDTLLDFSPVADRLFASYAAELNRS